MIGLLLPGYVSFVTPGLAHTAHRRPTMKVTWAPEDLTKDRPGFPPITDDDYVRQYQRRPELWPVEFFLIAYRRRKNNKTQILVRKSANGTSKWGVGTGVPATRWVLSTA